jgi:hypothetical protein
MGFGPSCNDSNEMPKQNPLSAGWHNIDDKYFKIEHRVPKTEERVLSQMTIWIHMGGGAPPPLKLEKIWLLA